MPDQPSVLILGGGFGGMFAARRMARHIPDHSAVELVDEHNYFVFQPLLPEVAAGTLQPADAVSPFRLLLPGITVTEARVTGIDLAQRRVQVVGGNHRRVRWIGYDHLLIALGTRVDLSRFPGLEEHAYGMKDLADAFRLRNHVVDCLEQADSSDDPELRRRLLTFAVIGGGLSGVETMGEIQDMIARTLRYYPRIRRSDIRLVLAEHAPRILPELPESLARYAALALGRRGIEVVTGNGVKSATADSVELADGQVVATMTVVATIGNAPHPLCAGLPLPRHKGRLVTDEFLRVKGLENVWAIGDCAWIAQRGDERAIVPPTGQAAAQEAECFVHNLKVAITGEGRMRPFAFRRRGQLASLGGRRGVAELYGRKVTGVAAWLLWRSAYLFMLPNSVSKVRVGFDWVMDALAPRSIVQFSQPKPRAVTRVRFRAGEVVYARGEWAGPIYVVEEGSFQRDPDPDGDRALIGPGGHFGEAAVKGEKLRRTTVRALEDSVCLAVDRQDFDRLASCFRGLHTYVGERAGAGS